MSNTRRTCVPIFRTVQSCPGNALLLQHSSTLRQRPATSLARGKRTADDDFQARPASSTSPHFCEGHSSCECRNLSGSSSSVKDATAGYDDGAPPKGIRGSVTSDAKEMTITDDGNSASVVETIVCGCGSDCNCRNSSLATANSSDGGRTVDSDFYKLVESFLGGNHPDHRLDYDSLPYICECDKRALLDENSAGKQFIKTAAEEEEKAPTALGGATERTRQDVMPLVLPVISKEKDHKNPTLKEQTAVQEDARPSDHGSDKRGKHKPERNSNKRFVKDSKVKKTPVNPEAEEKQHKKANLVSHAGTSSTQKLKRNLAKSLSSRSSGDDDRRISPVPTELIEEHKMHKDCECLETYGDTILDHFRKEELEKEHEIYDKPRLFSPQMRLLICIMEVTIIALFTVFIHWLVVVRKATFGFLDVVGVVSTTGDEEQRKTIDPAKLDLHMTIYMTIFVILLPHVLILSVVFEYISTTRLAAISFTLKLLSFCLFFGGLFDIQASISSTREDEVDKDFRTHYCFSQGAVVVFIMYIVITSVKLAGHLFRRIFQIRVLGSIFRIVVSDWFVDSVDHLTYGAGYISLLTGLTGYLFFSRKDEPLELVETEENAMTVTEGWYIRIICMMMAVLYFTILSVNFQKHFINNHTHFITVDVFKEVFLQLRTLYEEENLMEMGQEMPKVTSAQRMV